MVTTNNRYQEKTHQFRVNSAELDKLHQIVDQRKDLRLMSVSDIVHKALEEWFEMNQQPQEIKAEVISITNGKNKIAVEAFTPTASAKKTDRNAMSGILSDNHFFFGLLSPIYVDYCFESSSWQIVQVGRN